jgi:Flp pilus assembly protein TadD
VAYLMRFGRVEQAVAELKQALDIDPNSMLTNRLSHGLKAVPPGRI